MPRIKKSLLGMACILAAIAYWGSPSHAEDDVASPPRPEAGASFAPQRSVRERAVFDHKRKEHAKASCNVCHRVTPAQIDVVAFPAHPTCIGCHNFAKEFFSRGQLFCGVCHEGGPSSKMRANLFNFKDKTNRTRALMGSDFGIDFSHVAHRKPLPQDFVIRPVTLQTPSALQLTAGAVARCTDCHQRIPSAKAGEREQQIEKGHSTCFQCHGMRPETGARENFPYMNDCKECHDVNGGKATLLTLIREFSHTDHDYDLRPRRKVDYQVKRPPDFLCVECHKSAEQATKLTEIQMPGTSNCASCHNGRIGLPDALAQEILNKLSQ